MSFPLGILSALMLGTLASAQDMSYLATQNFLIGESLMRQADVATATLNLLASPDNMRGK